MGVLIKKYIPVFCCVIRVIVLACLFAYFTIPAVSAQISNIKTNLLYDATATINLGAEFKLSRQTTLDVSGNYNNWTFSDNKKWKNWMIQPEFRYRLFKRFNGHYRMYERFNERYQPYKKLSGHFFGLHVLIGQFNFNHVKLPFGLYPDLQNYNYQGDFYGGGLSYGYQWVFGRHWGLEATIGLGYLYVKYDKYPCAECGEKLESGDENYWGITKAGISLIYFIF